MIRFAQTITGAALALAATMLAGGAASAAQCGNTAAGFDA